MQNDEKLKRAIALLEKYEALEADIVMNNECWMTASGLPEFTQDQWDKVIELQGERNEILERFQNP